MGERRRKARFISYELAVMSCELRLGAGEAGGALFEEGLDAFALVGGDAQAAEGAGFEGEAIFEREIGAEGYGFEGGGYGERGLGGDLEGQGAGVVEQGGGGDDFVDEAYAEGL
jgi:hypothetical protein